MKKGASDEFLDLGCGTGHPIATHIASRGHRIVGVDGSKAMLAVALERLPEHRWIHDLLERVEFAETFSAAVSTPVTSNAAAGSTGTPVDVVAVSPPAVHPADKPAAVPHVFDAMALMEEGDRPRERESQVFLVDGKINVKAKDDDSLLYTLPFDEVLSISYSRGRDPLWSGPEGPTPVTRAGGGLGIFRGTRHWVSLRTRNTSARFVVLRLSNGARAKSAIAALEERTGRRATIVAESQGDK